jgi:uncharacterized phage protein gp47/JayE
MSNYKARTKEQILQSLLNNIPDDYLKDVGTFTRDLNASVAIEAQLYENQIQALWEYFDIETITGEELEKRVFQLKGLSRKKATFAIGEITVTGNGTVAKGNIFETPNAIQFEAVETVKIVNVGKVKIQAVVAGKSGNVGAGTITLMPVTIQGIKFVNNEKQTYDGFDAETDASLLERYLIAVRTPATSGNVYHYKQWAREVEGVGDTRIFPLWNGANTVKVVIIDDNQQPASLGLVKKVQDHIDPMGEDNATWGAGYGEAPIGAYCTVQSAASKDINVNVTLIKDPDADFETLKKSINKSIVEFLQEIAFVKNYVSYSLLANAVLETPGVVEWTSLTINGGTSSIVVGDEEVAILKGLVINEQQR